MSVNGNYSSRKSIKYSVPQGSILGPILFIIYINDLPNISQLARYILYADDANIIITGDTIQEVHEKFNTVSSALIQWVRDNELLLNVKKTNYMIFTNRRHVDLGNVAFKMGETPIERSSVARFLGVLIDDKLTWNQHIMAVRHKMSRYIGSIFRIKHMLPMRCRLLTYNSLVMSHLNYCSLVWGGTNKTKIEKLFTVQKKAIRAIMEGPVNLYYKEGVIPTHTKPAFIELKIPTVHNIITMNMLIFVRKVLCTDGNLPESVAEIISRDSPCHVDEVDYSSEWYRKYSQTPYATSILFKAPLLHNLFHDKIFEKCAHNGLNFSMPSYKNAIKQLIHDFQSLGSETDWETSNFMLYSSLGLRRSNRNKRKPAVDYRE